MFLGTEVCAIPPNQTHTYEEWCDHATNEMLRGGLRLMAVQQLLRFDEPHKDIIANSAWASIATCDGLVSAEERLVAVVRILKSEDVDKDEFAAMGLSKILLDENASKEIRRNAAISLYDQNQEDLLFSIPNIYDLLESLRSPELGADDIRTIQLEFQERQQEGR